MIGGNTPNLILKEIQDIFLKFHHSGKYYNFKTKIRNIYKKENFKQEIKPMIENLQNEFHQLENKLAKGTKLCANIRRWTAKNAPKLSSKYLKDKI